ncbi:fibrinogen-related protein 3.3 [Elysia marginata]|uniref:Fibrinogen-related protein 3.3 n=1 Tax=Elysia marginata TaxID=1093978 RepID=A0AAV4J9E8_9GAST|nr:fibrinogen-related protein 3.3 [Elysia marginata]
MPVYFHRPSGLEFRLSRAQRDMQRSRSCGVLLCKEDALIQRDDNPRNITELILYQVVDTGLTNGHNGAPDRLRRLASLSPSNPNLLRVLDGMKFSGDLKNGQATLRVELSKQTNCLTEYICEVQEVDSKGKELITSSRLLQQPDQSSIKDDLYDQSFTSPLLMRLLSVVQGLDVKLATTENFLKDKLNSVEDRALDLRKELTDKLHSLENSLQSQLTTFEKSSDKMETKLSSVEAKLSSVETKLSSVETKLSSVETNLSSVETKLSSVEIKLSYVETKLTSIEDSWEDKAENLQKELTNKLNSLEISLQKEASINFKKVEDKLCHLEAKLASIDSDALQQKVLSTIKDQVDEHFIKVLNATEKADDTLNKTAGLVTALRYDNTNFQNDIMARYKNVFENVSRNMEEMFLQNTNLTSSMAKSLLHFKSDLDLSFDRIEVLINGSVANTLISLQCLKSGLNSSISAEVESVSEDFFVRQTGKENTPVPQQPATSAYPVLCRSNILGLKIPILCDTLTENGGWIVIQRRSRGDVDFYRNWASYKEGFGKFDTDFWLGLENIHAITRSGKYELRVDLKYNGQSKYAVYDNFSLAGEDENYKITVGSYTGTAGDGLSSHDGQQFSTYDRHNDKDTSKNCASLYTGAWWYFSMGCHHSNLNGKWQASSFKGPRWRGFTRSEPASFTEMKIRRLGD